MTFKLSEICVTLKQNQSESLASTLVTEKTSFRELCSKVHGSEVNLGTKLTRKGDE
jgi:hypothetical protein